MDRLPPSTSVPEGYLAPAEWAQHRACWLAWPCHANLWAQKLGAAQAAFIELCRAIADVDERLGERRGEQLEVLVPGPSQEELARPALAGLGARFHHIPYGDIWLRDTAPVFLVGPKGRATVRFRFNGWGGKYLLPHDDRVSETIAERAGLTQFSCPFVLEGGSIDVDGEGTVLTTRQCLLNANRNADATEAKVEQWLAAAVGARRVLWLDQGLLNDHTDGHIDTLARFVAPGAVVCMEARSKEDPNHDVLEEIASALARFKDSRGRSLEVIKVPSPGRIVDEEERVMPASYVNFYIGNRTVAVPTYGAPSDGAAVTAIARLFPGRQTIGIDAKAILSGGGAFHCITQQEPA